MATLVIATALALGAAGAATVAAPATAGARRPPRSPRRAPPWRSVTGSRPPSSGPPCPRSSVARRAGTSSSASAATTRSTQGVATTWSVEGTAPTSSPVAPASDRLYGQRDLLQEADEDGIERVGDTLRGGPGDDRLSAGADAAPPTRSSSM